MRVRKWIAVAGGVLKDTFEWEDGEGNFGRCLIVKTEELKEKASRLDGKRVLITAYYPKNYEKTGELGVLLDIREAKSTDFEKHKSMLESNNPVETTIFAELLALDTRLNPRVAFERKVCHGLRKNSSAPSFISSKVNELILTLRRAPDTVYSPSYDFLRMEPSHFISFTFSRIW